MRTVVRTLPTALILVALSVSLSWRRQPLARYPLPDRSAQGQLGQFQRMMRAARRRRLQAMWVVNDMREQLMEWDENLAWTAGTDAWRLQEMARDAHGYLHQARAAVAEAAYLAGTTEEQAQAAVLQALVEHELGEHATEYQLAIKLRFLAPGSPEATAARKRASDCQTSAAQGKR